MSSYTYSSSQYANSVAYIDGSVYTVNDLEPWADGFIVSEEGVFLHVGSTTEIWTIAKKFNIVTIHLNDQFVMPGIHDAHMSVGPGMKRMICLRAQAVGIVSLY
jgi:predicted amidohydrolase YtcJ